MQLTVNGRATALAPDWQDESLLHALREGLGLVGAKFGCGAGLCGACTVRLDGEPVRACQLRAGDCVGRRIDTVEGLAAPDGRLHPVQQAWLDEAVPQCGYCQAGQIVAVVALLERQPRPSDAEVDAALAGHLCRCGTQPRVRRAVARAAQALAGGAR
jgi:isoquinoline 1-oxidoreductase alpha subunit